MALISWTDIKGIHDTIIDAFDAGMKSGKISYSTPERAAEYRKDALHVNEIVNAISDFVVGTNMSAQIQEYHPGCTSWVELRDTPDFKDEWYGFKIKFELCWSRDGVAVTYFADRAISKDSQKDNGWAEEFHKHSKTFFKHFGAEKWSNSEYYFKREVFVAAIPKMIKYFNKSNTLNRNRERNAKIINEIKQGLRKKEVKAIQFNTIAALAEEWVKGIDPNLHIAVEDISPKGSTQYSCWRLNIVNSRPTIWYANRAYNDNFHNLITRPLDSNTLTEKRYILANVKTGQAIYRRVRDWVTDAIQGDASFSVAERDDIIKEACRQPASIGNLYTCDPRFNDNIKDETAYADLSFTVVLNYEKNFWNVRYSRRDQLPFRFQQLLNFGCTTELENFEYVVEYMEQCIRVEELLWQKADEQWYDLADIFKKDQLTRQFLITRNTYCAWGVDTKYSGTADPDTVVDNINNLAAAGIVTEL